MSPAYDRSSDREPRECPYGCQPTVPQSDVWVFGDAAVALFASILTMVLVLLRHPITCLALAILVGMVGEVAGWG